MFPVDIVMFLHLIGFTFIIEYFNLLFNLPDEHFFLQSAVLVEADFVYTAVKLTLTHMATFQCSVRLWF